ncbi:hypothetical protein GGF46_003932 [Coemansia sp. RSA 552]|nr:hypothetical protein GGF46_003932 [Coemansia sp. RSA 552]
MAKPKILCLHGFGEDSVLFKIRARNFCGVVGDSADLVFVDAPIDIGILRETTGNVVDADIAKEFTNLAWWWARSDRTLEARGIDRSLAFVKKVLTEQGPFDGVLGFSQGATMAAIVTALLEGQCDQGALSLGDIDHPPFKFAVFAGAFKLDVPQFSHVYSQGIATPTMHMLGTYDTVVEPERSRALVNLCVAPEVFEFVGGHFLPHTPKCARAMRAFLARFIPEIAAKKAEIEAAADAAAAAAAVAAAAVSSSAESSPAGSLDSAAVESIPIQA